MDGHNADDRLRELAKASPNFRRLYGYQPLLAVYGSQAELTVLTNPNAAYVSAGRSSRVESEDENGPFRKFTYEDLIARDKVNLDITWMKDPALDDADSGLAPEVIAEEIVRDLQSALNEFTAIARSLGAEVDVPEAEVE